MPIHLEKPAIFFSLLAIMAVVLVAWVRPGWDAASIQHAQQVRPIPPAPEAETGRMMRRRGQE